jgi:hypothetical protein
MMGLLGRAWKPFEHGGRLLARRRWQKIARSLGHEKIIFIHLQKTAGTTAVRYLRHFFAPERSMSHGDCLEIPRGQLRDYDFISGHFGIDYVEDILAGNYSFTFLREPVERVVSQYTFLNQAPRSEKTDRFPLFAMGRRLTLDEFVRSTNEEVTTVVENMQAWQLAYSYSAESRNELGAVSDDELLERAMANLAKLTRVGFKETFDRDFTAILADLRLPTPGKWGRLNRTPKPVPVESVDPETRAIIESRVAVDLRLYEHARDTYGK